MVARAVRRSGSAGRFAPLQKPPSQDESVVGKTDTKAIEVPIIIHPPRHLECSADMPCRLRQSPPFCSFQAPKKVGVAAESISDRLLQSFGVSTCVYTATCNRAGLQSLLCGPQEVSNNQWAKTVIASELKNYLRLGRKVISVRLLLSRVAAGPCSGCAVVPVSSSHCRRKTSQGWNPGFAQSWPAAARREPYSALI